MRPLDGYPTSWGSSRSSVFPHAGPASYTQIVIDSPPGVVSAGGDLVEAVEAGMKYFDIVFGSLADSGIYFVRSVPVARSDYQPGAQTTTYRLQWCDAATGVEVSAQVDLSAEIVRLLAIGPK